MKKLYTIALVLLCAFVGKAQIINIPDAAFKAKLLEADATNSIASTQTPVYDASNHTWSVYSYNKIDTNNDGEIQVSEAQAIKYLNVNFSLIIGLEGIESFTNLIFLDCNYNQLTSLNVQGLTNLQGLECYQNQITSLNVQGLSNLQTLYCRYNLLPSLNVQGLTNLQLLNFEANQLTSLNVQGLTNLKYLVCSYNHLTSLNVQGLTNLLRLGCYGNQLTALFIKNSNVINWEYFDFGNNPNLTFICTDEADLTYVQQKVNQNGYINCQVNSYCSFTPGGTFYTIQGNNNLDLNNNGCDASDSFYPNLKFNITSGSVTGSLISNALGNYSIPVVAGTHTITPQFENPSYFTISPANAVVSFPTTASPYVQDFCVTANGSHNDLEVIIMPIGGARPGFDAYYKIIYKNKGNQTQSGSVNFTFDDAVLDLVSAIPAVTSQVLYGMSWDFSNLHPFETREIVFTLNVNAPTETPVVNAGDVLNYATTISSTATETTPADNTFAYNQTVVNAFDPNEKVCLEGNTIAPAKVGDFVHYIIRFENDGTANAQNIVVKDMIDTTKFDIATLIPESGSASYTTRITNTNQVEFIFQNINLPFATGSNTGYVAFKIKTKSTLVLGNTFSNTASIYFDYNFPIITNTATTTIQALATQDFEFSTYFTIYPNPAKNVLNISTKSTIEVHSLTIYNLLGQVVLAIPNAQNLNAVDVSSLKTGHYFLKITSDKGGATEKFMKE